MDRLAVRVAARYAAEVLPFNRGKPRKPSVPTVEIGGKKYVLSTDGGPLGDAADPKDHGIFGYGDPEEGHARLIDVPHQSTPWKYLWAYDTERQHLGMWRASDGNEKFHGSARNEQGRIVRLDKRGELNRVTSAEMNKIEHEMRRREDDMLQALKKTIQESKTDTDRQVDALSWEFFEHHVKPKLERAISDAKRGVVPLGFKPFGPGEHDEHARLRQTISYLVGQVFKREMTYQKLDTYLEQKGMRDLDPQASEWAIHEVLEKVYDLYLPPYEA